ncbi:hypothetical protein BX616_001871 [Lobosporangium transversale]|uniref:CWC16 protein n=1 Tax=Lobosporangium transversale TaxID=64571 RepID=A0A1Y2GTF2_9FUNG|nr:hypothetical protein BCR41DRAFT_349642 [Lobosporangium transversale]KAF9902625.1 hypothetical protein BX616_001871 [Lobosporangium transversale]ORZ22770.1 hypothetical protein BCR41DRAFT_349642 [Lobosporangium transversale]|eukprot:XP_021883324.1 hypothetical protein BCR41DRAFT_349642 [Lobosporangium transversale]
MAERKATNKYYPPDWDPSKGSINTYVGQHPLRDRARKLDQGILVVRFELPYTIWCNQCDNSIAKGVRFNAEKKKIGNYYSTPILSFRMRCHLCSNWFEIQTDPKNALYLVTAGARKKDEDFNASDNETLELDSPEELERRVNDKFAQLEHAQKDVLKAQQGVTQLTRLQQLNDRQWSDPYTQSQRLRKGFRTEKKQRLKAEAECQAIADRVGLTLKVLPESQQDRDVANKTEFASGQKDLLERKLKEIKSGALFSKSKGGSKAKGLVKSPGVSKSSDKVVRDLASVVTTNTLLQVDPFLIGNHNSGSSTTAPIVIKPAPVAKTPLVSYGGDESNSDDGL